MNHQEHVRALLNDKCPHGLGSVRKVGCLVCLVAAFATVEREAIERCVEVAGVQYEFADQVQAAIRRLVKP